jgi:hypothetical protein
MGRDTERINRDDEDLDLNRRQITPEVGSEGGSPGDAVETDTDRGPGSGSEAGETLER